MKKSKNQLARKIIVLSLLILFTFVVLTPKPAFAQASENFSYISCVTGLNGTIVTCAIFVVAYLAASILGFFVALGAWLINVALTLNQSLLNSPAVKTGFGISLAIANLGFVLAIIIIAIATILRLESYGLKKMLWKLVVAALLVNFSLVIGGAIFNFSNQLGSYFIKGAVGDLTTGNIATDNSTFVNKIVSAFAPQNLLKSPTQSEVNDSVKSDFGDFVVLLLNVVFVILFMGLIAIAMFGIAIMIIIRYVAISILLILMPLVWMLWVLPGLSGNWNAWWKSFWRWCFFVPITLFFLYLGVLTVTNRKDTYIAQIQRDSKVPEINGNNPAYADASETIKRVTAKKEITEEAAQMVVALALIFGGLMAANKLSIEGSGMAMNAVKSAGKLTGGWAGRRAGRMATRPLRGKWGQKMTTGMQRLGTGRGPLGKLIAYGGRGLESIGAQGGTRELERAREDIKHLDNTQAKNRFSTATAPQRIALMERAQKEGWLGEIKNIESYIGKNKEKEFNNYGAGKLHEQVRRESMLGLKELIQNKKKVGGGGVVKDDEGNNLTEDQIQERINKFYKTFTNAGEMTGFFKSDYKDGLPLDSDQETFKEMQRSIARAVADGVSGATISSFAQKMDRADNVENFRQVVEADERETGKQYSFGEPVVNFVNSTPARSGGITGKGMFGSAWKSRPPQPRQQDQTPAQSEAARRQERINEMTGGPYT
jgi:hypothetical protein